MSDVNSDADESVVVEVQPDALRQEIDRAGARQDEIDEEIQERNLDFQLNMRQGLGEVSSPVILIYRRARGQDAERGRDTSI